MLKTRTIHAFSLMGVLILLLSACGAPPPSTSHSSTVVKGGTWIEDAYQDTSSLLPNASIGFQGNIDQALYAALFYGDSQGAIHPGLVTEMPTVANGGVSPDAKTWTFKLRPGLVWSDGQPLTAEDVDFTWRLWTNPKFTPLSTTGFNLINSADVSADKLAITFHLKTPFSPFIAVWTDGLFAPLPKHKFAGVAPDQILKTPENLNPLATSGPFMMSESKPGDHYTVVRNPKYYRAAEGLPYLDKIIFRIVPNLDTVLKDLQAGSITSAYYLDGSKGSAYAGLANYHFVYAADTSGTFQVMSFNFHHPILGKDVTVRKAIAMAIDHQALVTTAHRGLAALLCTDHSKAYHPGYQPDAPCPTFDPAAANALLEQDGWTKGPDGVRSRGSQRLEFTYSTSAGNASYTADEEIIQANLQAIGIKLNIHNYPDSTFFGTTLFGGKPGQYDLAEYVDSFNYDADDASLLSCNQVPPNGFNVTFYCNPALDKLYLQEESTVDTDARQQAFNQIHQIYLTDFPIIFLYGSPNLYIAKKTTHNYQPGPFGAQEAIKIWEWSCDGGHC